MKPLPLNNGMVTFVNDDFEWSGRWELLAVKRVNTYYAVFRPWDAKTKTTTNIYLHRFIMSAPKDTEVDHWDGNGLHNWRENLRFATRTQQLANSALHPRSTSGYRGVCWDKSRGLWLAKVGYCGKQINVGRYSTAEEASDAREALARKLFGKFYRERHSQAPAKTYAVDAVGAVATETVATPPEIATVKAGGTLAPTL